MKKIVFALLTLVSSSSCHRNRNTVYGCEDNKLDLTCDSGKVINIIRANFGRISSNICVNKEINSNKWSTRCIQPTTLRQVTNSCGNQVSTCSIPVSSQVFGDPCPGTPKYLEVVYTCQSRDSVTESPDLPPWLLSLEAISNRIMMKTTTSTTSTTTTTTKAISTTTDSTEVYANERDIEEIEEIMVIETNEIEIPEPPQFQIRQPSSKFLRYLERMKETNNQEKRISLMLNNPREPQETVDISPNKDQENITAAIVIAVIATLMLLAAVIIVCCCKSKSKSTSSSSDTESNSSGSSYLSYSSSTPVRPDFARSSVIVGKDGKLYQQVFISNNVLSSQNHTQYSSKQQTANIYDYADLNPQINHLFFNKI